MVPCSCKLIVHSESNFSIAVPINDSFGQLCIAKFAEEFTHHLIMFFQTIAKLETECLRKHIFALCKCENFC